MLAHTHDEPAVVTLQARECWAALRTTDLGRLAFTVDERPEIFPVSYVVDGGTIVFRTGVGSRITTILDGRPVAFQADGRADGFAWSVIVKGQAREVRDLYDSIAAADLPLRPLSPGRKDCLVRVTPVEITGRQFNLERYG
jgi:nitroimidazol reductase NimA-like FMN-containing flavoprotein (pyridoxamine 5'-phosphate oxidase superfamily)